MAFPGSSADKESACHARDPSGKIPWRRDSYPLQCFGASMVAKMERIHLQCRRPGFDPWVGKIPWRRAWQASPVLLPGESPWTEEPGRLQSMGSQRVGHDRMTKHRTDENIYRVHTVHKVTESTLQSLVLEELAVSSTLLLTYSQQPPSGCLTKKGRDSEVVVFSSLSPCSDGIMLSYLGDETDIQPHHLYKNYLYFSDPTFNHPHLLGWQQNSKTCFLDKGVVCDSLASGDGKTWRIVFSLLWGHLYFHFFWFWMLQGVLCLKCCHSPRVQWCVFSSAPTSW